MPFFKMNGPYYLISEEIDKHITKKSIGNYALGCIKDSRFIVRYIGRSDTDLNERLKFWIGNYEQFKFSYTSSPKQAFEEECLLYHDFGASNELDNTYHPQRPENRNWECPCCQLFE